MNAINPDISRTPTRRWEHAHDSLRQPHPYRRLSVQGSLPADLYGTCYRSGPALMSRFGVHGINPFEADGAVTSERFDGQGRAYGAARLIESVGYREEERHGGFRYGTLAPPLLRTWRGLTAQAKNTGNTAVWHWQGRLYSLVEAALPTELDPYDLSTLQETRLGGLLRNTLSAHPHRVASRSCTYNFGITHIPVPYVNVYAFPDQGPARKVTSFLLPFHTIVHDFVATSRYAVFIISPARLSLTRALFQIPPFEDWFTWEPERGCQIVIVPLDDPSRIRRLSFDALWCWHIANGFDQDGEITLDLARYDDLSSLRSLGQGTPIAPPHLQRMRIDLRRDDVTLETVLDASAEFPRIHPGFEGEAHRYVWCQYGTPDEREGIARVDTHTGTTRVWPTPPGSYVCEPILVPRPGGRELDAWVLTRVYDPSRDEHYTAVLDARAPEVGPVAQVWHGQRLPTPFHGTWVAA